MSVPELPSRVLFFDGVCVMCNGLVQWLIDADEQSRFRFAPLQGETAQAMIRERPDMPSDVSTIVYIEDGRMYLRSRAVFQAARQLRAPYRWLSWFRFLPTWLTDPAYKCSRGDSIQSSANTRFAWFRASSSGLVFCPKTPFLTPPPLGRR
ncbi:MAG: DCC1-like thiol-disulfide oxidoreductase family protein [Polyangiales bacterium]